MKSRTAPYHHGDLPAQLVLAGIRALRTQPADSLSLRELSKELGVSYNAPRRHFPSKQVFLDALALEGYALLSQALETAKKVEGEFEQCLKGIAGASVRFVLENRELFDLMLSSGRRTEAPTALKDAFHRTWQAGPELVRAGQQNGSIVEGDADELFQVFYCWFVGLVSGFETPPDSRIQAQVDRTVERLLNGLRPR